MTRQHPECLILPGASFETMAMPALLIPTADSVTPCCYCHPELHAEKTRGGGGGRGSQWVGVAGIILVLSEESKQTK